MDDNNIQKELEQLGSSLAGRTKEQAYRSPEGYFDTLPQLVATKIAHPTPSSVWRKILRPAVIIPSAVTAFSFGIMIFFNVTRNINNTDVTADDILQSNYAYEIDESLITESIEIEDDNVAASDTLEYLLDADIEMDDLSQMIE